MSWVRVGDVDIDAFVAVHQGEWDRLAELSSRSRPTADEADELLRLYQRTSTHLSMIQAHDPGGAVAAGLSARLGRARGRLTGGGDNLLVSIARFVTQVLPAAFHRVAVPTVVIGALFLLVSGAFALWTQHHPQIELLMSDEARAAYARDDFVDYYSDHPNASFAAQVWTNNAWIAAQEVALGVTGVWVPAVLLVNAQGLGISAGVMFEQGEAWTFWAHILPHGLMELTAVFVAGAAGLRIFWAWVAPGRRRRLTALAEEGRRLITVAIGLTAVLLVSGVVEGFVTPSDLPAAVKILIGAAVLAGYWTYTLVLGGRARQAGITGDLARYDSGAHELTA